MNSQPHPVRHQGTFAHLTGMLATVMSYAGARVTLAGLELKNAGMTYGIAAAMAAGGLFVAVLGYFFLVITAVFGIAAAFDNRHAWIIVLGCAALLHLGGAAALVVLARARVKAGAFPQTMAELKNDQQWLKQLAKEN